MIICYLLNSLLSEERENSPHVGIHKGNNDSFMLLAPSLWDSRVGTCAPTTHLLLLSNTLTGQLPSTKQLFISKWAYQ